MAFKIKGQTKAPLPIKGIEAISCPIGLRFCMQVAHWPLLAVCFMAFEIKGQTKAMEAFLRFFIRPLTNLA